MGKPVSQRYLSSTLSAASVESRNHQGSIETTENALKETATTQQCMTMQLS
jgi:hypothetical protein